MRLSKWYIGHQLYDETLEPGVMKTHYEVIEGLLLLLLL
jgi:hypothetical protein